MLLRGVLPAGLAGLLSVTVLAGSAVAQPAPAPVPGGPAPGAPAAGPAQAAPPTPVPRPTTAAGAAGAADQLRQVQREAEQLTEQWHAAQDDLAARRAALGPLQAAVEPAKAAVATAHADEERFRVQSDALAAATFQTGNLDQLNALLASGSPQDYLDQMSTLETVSADQRAVLDRLRAVIDRANQAQAAADAAVARAQTAADQAAQAERDILVRKQDAEKRMDQAARLLARLDPQQRADYLGPLVGAPGGVLTGSGIGARALRVVMSQLGKPYEWGAAGPGSFDCSGLMYWSFRQVGVTLPRSSRSQSGVGRPVAFSELQPGDLIFFYSPVSHVGIYAGGGKMIDSPQTGDVVRYAKVDREDFAGARRLP